MATVDATNVSLVFDMMLEEVEAQIDLASRAVGQASDARDFARVKEAAEQAEWLVAFRDRVVALREEWAVHAGPADRPSEAGEPSVHRRNLGRLRKGERTPEQVYYPVILQVLREMGGSASIGEVLDRVGERMKNSLQEVDLLPLNSDPETPRWRNSAQWARHELVKQGLMRDDSPRAIWAISEAGRKWLGEHSERPPGQPA